MARKRKLTELTTSGVPENKPKASMRAAVATSLTDGVQLSHGGILPWVGFGTYKLPKENARPIALEALRTGYRCIDTAFIYGGEKVETQVGCAIDDAIQEGILTREEVFVQTKQWRKYHGYEPTKECLRLSLKRLDLDYIDLWLIHWPGPAYNTMTRKKEDLERYGPWHHAVHSQTELQSHRAGTWRAMEEAVDNGQVRAIGVSNFSIEHLEQLKKTARIWPPAVNQIECHPLFPQSELVEYCNKEGIIVQAYASLGGQDTGKAYWRKVYQTKGKDIIRNLTQTPPVVKLAKEVGKTPAQVLLRWALEKNIAIVPKSVSTERMVENTDIFNFSLTTKQIERLESELQTAVEAAADEEGKSMTSMRRLCWRRDPLRDLDFD